jgi:alanine or glycine:cation symporter, AGCS family
VLGCLAVLIHNWSVLPESIAVICKSAFTGSAVAGGFIGRGLQMAMQMGIARGLFSNESGLGSAPIVAAAAQTRNPVRQALVSATGTFWDTVVVCLMTGLVIVSSGLWKKGMAADGTMMLNPDGSAVLAKAELVQNAFATLGDVGPTVLTIGLLTFVFSTILGWCYYGEKATEYLFGTRAVLPYRLFWVVAVYIGSTQKTGVVWAFSDAMNALMAIPNLIALICLGKVISSETKAHQNELTGKNE